MLRIPGIDTHHAVKALLFAIDVDKDGKLSYAELSQAVKRGQRLLAELKHERAKAMQENVLISQVFEKIARKMGKEGGVSGRKMLKAAFSKMDTDQSGFLDQEELLTAMRSSLDLTPSQEEEDAMKVLVDSHPLQRVSWVNFETLLTQHASVESMQSMEDAGWRKVLWHRSCLLFLLSGSSSNTW